MNISKFSHKLQALFFEQREKYQVETVARSFSGVKWSCGLWAPCFPPFLCKAAALEGVCRMSSARVTHQVLTLFFHCSHVFPTQWPTLPTLLGTLCARHTPQNPECRAQTLLCSHPPRCSPLTDHRVENLHHPQACWQSWMFDRRPGCVKNFP